MGVRYDGLITAKKPGAAIASYRLVKHGSADGTVVQAIDGTAPIIGVCTRVEAAATNSSVDIVRGGVPKVQYGGAVARGDPLTSDAHGKAVRAVAQASEELYIAGFAEVSGAAEDIGSMLFCPSQISN